jgi:hypothetical protein
MARMIIVAVVPLATVAPNSSTVACEPLPAICTKPLASLNIRDGLHRGSDAIHIYSGGIGGYSPVLFSVLVFTLELKLPPAWHQLGAYAKRAAKSLDRDHRVVRGLAVDKQGPSGGQNEIAPLTQSHN